jgi:hypothetical protein
MKLEAEIEGPQRCTCCNGRARLEQYWNADNQEAINLYTVVRVQGVTGPECLSFSQDVIVGMQKIEYNMICREMGDWLGAGPSESWEYGVRGVCSTQCMLYSVYAVLGVSCIHDNS